MRLEQRILAATPRRFTKVAKVVGQIMVDTDNAIHELEIVQGIKHLVRIDALESAGDVEKVRFAEIRRLINADELEASLIQADKQAASAMHLLVTLSIPASGLTAFEAYEAAVLPLLACYGARLEARVRTKDGTEETHLIWFPDSAAYDAYMADEARAAAAPLLAESGASASVKEVESLL